MQLAEAYRQEGLLDDALRILRDGLTREPGSISGRLALARLRLEQTAFDEALAEAERIEELAPDSLEVLELKAQILWLRRASPPAPEARSRQAPEIVAGPSAGLASPTLAALYAAQGYTERAEALKVQLAAAPEGSGGAESPAADAPLLCRLAAFRDAARRRREELQP